MSQRTTNQVTHDFPKVNVTYEPPKHFLQRLKLGSRRPTIETDPETETTPSQSCEIARSSWFQRLDIEHNHGTCTAPPHIIDVQPDFRHPLAYILFSVRELYGPVLFKQADSHVSLLTLVYYCQTLVVATLLFYDMYSRPSRSCFANAFLQGNHRSEFCDLLFELRVPDFMSQILSSLSPAFDAHQPRLLFIPTLAGFSFRHDFGRLVPPAIFLAAQSASCERKPDYDPMELLRRFYSTKIISIGGKDYYVTNFVGGPYLDEDEVCDHTNWIRPTIESFLRSNDAGEDVYCQYIPLNYGHENNINPYEFMFCNDQANQTSVRSLLKSISHFFQEKEPLSQALGNLLSSPSGITIMSHFYAAPTLPTCHSLPPPPVVYETEHSFVDDVQFAGKSRFLSSPTVEAEAVRVRFTPLGHERFDHFVNVRGDIFGFQPYGQDLASLGAAITLGLTIENGDIDGVTISQPNLRLSLCDNNSRLLQGALPRRVVRAYIPDFKAGNGLILLKRSNHSSARPNNPVGFARCDMGQLFLKSDEQLADIPVEVNGNYYTYMAWSRSDERLPIPDSSIYFWSSYRYISKDCEYPDVHFYYTLKALYGNVVNMTSLNNPSWLFPG